MTEPLTLSTVTQYLDDYLKIRSMADEANAVNGLQVENSGTIERIIAAVDASLETIEAVPARALLLVHHGLFWDGNIPVTGRRYRRIRALFARDVALYAAHIPLDAHAEVGNNAVLATMLCVRVTAPFGMYRGTPIGVQGELSIDRDALLARINEQLATTTHLIPGGPDHVQRIGIVTGAASSAIREAADSGVDTFITGEGPHHTHFDAMEWGVNVLYAGHYATEQVGVRALAEHLGARYDLPWEFHRHPTGL
jgi:dinuclear metal center YbgI/SA1388 family protein